jgi:selenocysteine lyase/cysteine desulfurase
MRLNRRDWLRSAGCLSAAAGPALGLAADSMARLPAKADFAVAEGLAELNNARWHPLSIPSMRAVQRYLDFKMQSPRESGDSIGVMQRDVKTLFAQLIGAKPSEISYVASTTVGENLVASALGVPVNTGNVVTDALHFEGSIYLYQALQKQGLDLRIVLPRDWRIELADLDKVIDQKTKLVALSLVSASTGFQHDLKAVCDLAHSRGAYVYADIVQAAGAIPIDVHASGVDFCACASYKWLMGDMGLGFLYVREDLLDRVVRRVQYGYRQLRGWQDHIFPYNPPADTPLTWQQTTGAGAHFEVGTISNTTVACLSHSLKYIQQIGVGNIQAHAQSMTQRLQKELSRLGFQSLTPPETRSPIVTFVVKDPAGTAARLQKANVSVRLGDHLIRISPSVYNDQADIDKLLNALS